MALTPPATVLGVRMASSRPVVETRHRVHIAVVAPDQRRVASAGDPTLETPLRSCAKPFQALALFSSGAHERFALSDHELALACASHDASARHLGVVRAWLERLGLATDDLACGAHRPPDRVGDTALHNNCSGKHTGMLATALALGAPTRDYLQLRHPVQREIVKNLARLGVVDADTPWAVDGCSAPTAVLSLERLAGLAALLAEPRAAPDEATGRALTALGTAMMTHPDLIGGRDVLDTRLMRQVAGVISKRGADGVQLLAVTAMSGQAPVGIAFKVEDGHAEARDAATIAVLQALDCLPPAARSALGDATRPPRKNHKDLTVGYWTVQLELHAP